MIEPCRDFRRLKRISDLPVHISPNIFYLMEVENGEDLGAWMAHPFGDGLSLHAYLGIHCRGKAALTSALSALDWLFNHNSVNVIYAVIPYFRRDVRNLANAVGFRFLQTDHYGNRIYQINRHCLRKAA